MRYREKSYNSRIVCRLALRSLLNQELAKLGRL